MASEARRRAQRILLDLEGRGPTLAERLAAEERRPLPARERAFLHELVLGSLRQRGRLDAALAPLTTRGLEALDPPALAALRLGAYQILALRVPDRAAVSESVDLARATAPRAAGLVNAVLRRLAREGEPQPPDPARDPLAWLVGPGSLPHWLAQRWLERLGPEAAVARARAFLAEPPCVLRLNPRRPEAEAESAPLRLEGLPVPGAMRTRFPAQARPLAERGLLFVQDQGSQLVAQLAASGGTVLDACAAPGAKATLIADRLAGAGAVIALEPSPRRLAVLRGMARRWGAPRLHCVRADARRPPLASGVDTVLIDAPCSGLGTLARHPDVRWRTGPADPARHARLQGALVAGLAPLVRPGGRLVYSTCSSEPEENERVVEAFLSRHAAFRVGAAPAWAAPFRSGRFLATLPERDGGDCFFVALLERN